MLDARYTKLVVRLVAFLVLAFIASEVVQQLPSVSTFNQEWIDSHTRNNGLDGVVNYILVATALLICGLPRQLVAFLGGYAFGFTEGVLYSTAAATISCLLSFLVARLFARPLVYRYFAARIGKVNHFLRHDTFLKTVVIRLLPIGNNLITNIVAGVTRINTFKFVAGSTVGYLPQMIIFALMGKGVVVQSTWKIGVSVALLGISSLIGFYLYKRYRADKTLESASEDQQSPTVETSV